METLFSTPSASPFKRLPTDGHFTLSQVPAKHVKKEGEGRRAPQYVARGTHFGSDGSQRPVDFAVPAVLAVQMIAMGEAVVGLKLVYKDGQIFKIA